MNNKRCLACARGSTFALPPLGSSIALCPGVVLNSSWNAPFLPWNICVQTLCAVDHADQSAAAAMTTV